MVPFRGNLILPRAVPVPRAKQAAPPGSQAPALSNGQNRINNSMPVSNLNLILHPDPRQFRIPMPKQRKRGPGACPPPPRGLQKKKGIPGFPLLQKVQTAPEFAQKGRSHGAARAHSKTKLLRSKNGAPHYSLRDIG